MTQGKGFYPQGEHDKLKIIKGIEFTPREVDILACVLNGRTAQKIIASFLTTSSRTVSPRTVETHLRNIIRKIGCSSQVGLIDFIEKSDKRSLIRKHYEYLQRHSEFEKRLANLRTSISPQPLCVIYSHSYNLGHIQNLASHLEIAGIKAVIKRIQDSFITDSSQIPDHTLYLIPQNSMEQSEINNEGEITEILKHIRKKQVNSKNLTFLSLGNTTNLIPAEFSKIGVVSINALEDYYLAVLKLIQRIVPAIDLKQTILDFEKNAAPSEKEFLKSNFPSEKTIPFAFTLADLLKNKRHWIIPLITVSASFLYLVDWLSKVTQPDKVAYISKAPIHSDLFVPNEAALLHRPRLMAQLTEKLKGNQNIQTVALIGIGGAGKTTLARYYAQQQKANFIWEINAETWSNLTTSFEKMTFALCQTEGDHKFLRSLQNIQNASEREEKILSFAKNKLRAQGSWFLVYDNVEKITDIQQYVPFDPRTWGNGKVIITTRDSHIQQNSHVHHTILIGELSPQEKLDLFIKIMSYGQKNGLVVGDQEEVRRFLEKIEPFPLDISVAAHYLKATKVSYGQYLEYLGHYSASFNKLQEAILKDAGNYTTTRYSIISLSIDRLLKIHEDFSELMLLVSMIDSQNIPRDLLETLKDKVVVDNFIYHLKKYSLITQESSNTSGLNPAISLHRSTQYISLQYLLQKLDLEKDNRPLQNISVRIKEYMDILLLEEELPTMRAIVRHLEFLLKQDNLLTANMKTDIGIQLGYTYFCLNRYLESQQLLESILKNLDNLPNKNYLNIADTNIYLGACYEAVGRYEEAKTLLEKGLLIYKKYSNQTIMIARVLYYLGSLYRDLGNYEKAKDFFKESCAIYSKHFSKKCIGFGAALGMLGIIFRELGNYEKAKDCLEQSINLYKHHPNRKQEIHHFLGSLGVVYSELGDYEKAGALLEQNLQFFNQQFSEKYGYTVHVLARLGNVYKNLGNYKKAKELLEKNIKMLKDYFPKRLNAIGRASAYLGDVYRLLGNNEEALNLLEEALVIYEQHYGKYHLETARVLKMIGQVYLKKGELKKAESHLDKAFKIFQKSNHPEIYTIFEDLAELSLKQSDNNKKNAQQAETFKKQSLDYLTQAQTTLHTHFPKDSPHLKRIQKKIEVIH